MSLENDLVVCYGFSRRNAKIAVNRFENGALSGAHNRALQFIQDNPMTVLNAVTKDVTRIYDPRVLEGLNYRITEELEDDMN